MNINHTREDWIKIAYMGFPAGRLHEILERWKTPGDLLQAAVNRRDDALLATPGITPKSLPRLREVAAYNLTAPLKAMEKYGIRLLLIDDIDYPEPLRQIADPPLYLFIRGQWQTKDNRSVAIVGTRRVTDYGAGIAAKFAEKLASHQFTIISGLARGIDTHAHHGALQAGRTIAVCGCGLDIVYPAENKSLMAKIVDNGACLSEYPPGEQPLNWRFPARNRIISGLTQATIVVESGAKSGALITADFALDQGKEIFAVPGNIHRPQSRGPHMLIKQGAHLAETVDDILEVLNNNRLPSNMEEDKSIFDEVMQQVDLTADERCLAELLDVEPQFIDDLAAAAGMEASQVNATLVLLEIKGVAKRLPGNTFARVI